MHFLTKNWVDNILFAKFALCLPDISASIVNEFTVKTLMLYIESQLKMSRDNFKLINHKWVIEKDYTNLMKSLKW